MSGPELGLAIFATVDICLGYVADLYHTLPFADIFSVFFFHIRQGKLIVEKYKTFKNARTEIEDRTLIVEATWLKISQQLEFLQRVWGSLDERLQDIQERVIPILQGKLLAVVKQISKLEKHHARDCSGTSSVRQSGRYALGMKESLEKALQELQTWQLQFDPSWYLLMWGTEGAIDAELKHPGADKLSVARNVRRVLKTDPGQEARIFLDPGRLQSARRSTIPHSTFQFVELEKSKSFILDSADRPFGDDHSIFRKDIRHLASRLQQVDPNTFHLLQCLGVVPREDSGSKEILSYDFIFKLPPEGSEPQSLRGHLLSRGIYSLGDRITLAKQLATSISNIHLLDIVHKNIRPETVLIFQDNCTRSKLGRSFLLGFKSFRMADGRTNLAGNSVLNEDFYRHPDRRGSTPRREYIMQHDIYSIGVCFLEIGLWQSFVNDGKPNYSLVEGEILKDGFIKLAQEKLPSTMGEKYMKVVVNCLSCLDATNEDFCNSTEFEDNDGIMLGFKYIEKVRILFVE
ncbi:unnamed protein product [Penicillium olsonii]|uniref:Protein kinase domain-containing protein n=1 Tax=Penicillium olsonii TaxID=99116 RepID=A0A9W4ML70_PENOL|nr:unnamed protein product [Penicillium olsonii]CAG8037500.1 unnamed protein product [Penicillium olsonii]